MDYNYNNIKRRGAAESADKNGRKRTARLLVCIAIFALALIMKLAAPSVSDDVGREVLGTIDESVDYKAAFSAIGSFVSGKFTLGEAIEAIKKMGSGGDKAMEDTDTEKASSFHASKSAENNLQSMYLKVVDARLERIASMEREAEESVAAMAPAEDVEYYEQESDLPENVSALAPSLPFEYTVPAEGVKSSDFGYRDHPINGEYKFHYGVDIAADTGTNIKAFADGHVAASGISETAGKYLIIIHSDGWVTQYFHCDEVYKTGGCNVKMGEVVAAVGETGAATGPNLHFELLHDGVYYDPWRYINEQG